jgi:hypothetical protein
MQLMFSSVGSSEINFAVTSTVRKNHRDPKATLAPVVTEFPAKHGGAAAVQGARHHGESALIGNVSLLIGKGSCPLAATWQSTPAAATAAADAAVAVRNRVTVDAAHPQLVDHVFHDAAPGEAVFGERLSIDWTRFVAVEPFIQALAAEGVALLARHGLAQHFAADAAQEVLVDVRAHEDGNVKARHAVIS